jgi:hypothetical protein
MQPKQSITRTVARSAQALTMSDLSRRNQVKADPYSNKTHKRIDTILVLATILLIAFGFRTAAQQRAASTIPPNHSGAAQQATSK